MAKEVQGNLPNVPEALRVLCAREWLKQILETPKAVVDSIAGCSDAELEDFLTHAMTRLSFCNRLVRLIGKERAERAKDARFTSQGR